jgi:hypothetical protein
VIATDRQADISINFVGLLHREPPRTQRRWTDQQRCCTAAQGTLMDLMEMAQGLLLTPEAAATCQMLGPLCGTPEVGARTAAGEATPSEITAEPDPVLIDMDFLSDVQFTEQVLVRLLLTH